MPARTSPARVPASWCGTGGIAVAADVAPDLMLADNSAARSARILVVWGVRFLGESLVEILTRDPRVTVVGLCTDLSEAVALHSSLHPDVVLLDARIPDGTAAVRRALDIAPGMRIVALAVMETENDVVTWAEAGVIGYIPSSAARSDLPRLIIDIHRGEQVCSAKIAAGLLRRIAVTAKPDTIRGGPFRAAALTKRERQAAELIRIGLSDKEIARRLNISLATTKSHVHNLLGKLNVRRRGEVADSLREHSQH